jgi:hypothetical protein
MITTTIQPPDPNPRPFSPIGIIRQVVPIWRTVQPCDSPKFDQSRYESDSRYESVVDAWWSAENKRLRTFPPTKWVVYLTRGKSPSPVEQSWIDSLPVDEQAKVLADIKPDTSPDWSKGSGYGRHSE